MTSILAVLIFSSQGVSCFPPWETMEILQHPYRIGKLKNKVLRTRSLTFQPTFIGKQGSTATPSMSSSAFLCQP